MTSVHLAGCHLARLGYKNVFIKTGSGEQGWKKFSPYKATLITAGIEEVPKELFKQLKIGGVLVAPVGKGLDKKMTRYTKINTNKYQFPINTNEHQLKDNLGNEEGKKKILKIIGKSLLEVETFGTFHFVPFVRKSDK